jgi:hypothetical protein
MKRSYECVHPDTLSTLEDGMVCRECGLVVESGRMIEGDCPLFRPYTHKEFEILKHVKTAYAILGKFYDGVSIPTDIPSGIGAPAIAAMIVMTNTTLDEESTLLLLNLTHASMKRAKDFFTVRANPPIRVADGFCYRHGLPKEIRAACIEAVRRNCMKDPTMICECVCLLAVGRVFQLRQQDVENYWKKLDALVVPDIRSLLIQFMLTVSDCTGQLTIDPVDDHMKRKGPIEECGSCMRFVYNRGRFLLTTRF